MDWIRRNWPDLLIGIALVAVIAGIIATLLTGGSFFPLGASQASNNRPEQSTTTSFDRGRSTAESRPVDSGTTNSSTANSRVDEEPEESEPEEAATPTTAEVEPDEPITVSALPLTGTTSSETQAPAQESTSAPAAAAERPVAGSGQSTDVDESGTYRISVGAFSGEENAQRQATTFREAGYPVFIGTQGDLSIVLVGPYDDLTEAERVAERIRGGGFRIEPVIYRFQAEADGESRPARSSEAPVTPTPQPTAAQASGGQFLQVGAYGTRESSLPQRDRLEGLGFSVSERVESGLIKLLVGPFAGDDMSEARALLNEQGIDHFPR